MSGRHPRPFSGFKLAKVVAIKRWAHQYFINANPCRQTGNIACHLGNVLRSEQGSAHFSTFKQRVQDALSRIKEREAAPPPARPAGGALADEQRHDGDHGHEA